MAAPKHRSWAGTLIQQVSALLIRNLIIAWRQWPATFLRLFAAFFFLFVLWLADVAIQKDSEDLDQFKAITNPGAEGIGAIPSCEEDYYIRLPCLDLLYTPNTNEVESFMDQIRLNNPGRVIPKEKTKGFPDVESANQYMLDNVDTVIAAVHLDMDVANQFLGYTLQTNATVKYFKSDFQDANKFVQLPLQQAIGREATKLFMDDVPDDFKYNMSLRSFAHPPTDTFSLVGQSAGFFLFAANMFAFVMQLFTVVQEKERGLRQALYSMGLMYSSNLLALLIFEACLVFISSLLMSAFGYVFDFELYTENGFSALLLLFFLFQLAMSSFAFLLSPLFNKATATIYFGFAVFIIGWVMQGVVTAELVYDPAYYYRWGGIMPIIFSLFPWPLFVKALSDFGEASVAGEGITFSKRDQYCREFGEDQQAAQAYRQQLGNDAYVDPDCVLSLADVYIYMFIQTIAYIIIGVYLDHVLRNEKGVRQQPWFFLKPGFWFPGRSHSFPVASSNFSPSNSGDKIPLHGTNLAEAVELASSSRGSEVQHFTNVLAKSTLQPNNGGRQSVGRGVHGEARFMKGGEGQPLGEAQIAHAEQGGDGGQATSGVQSVEDPDVVAERKRLMEANQKNEPRQALEVLGLCKTFGKFKAVNNAWWSAQQGTVLALLGPNGAGKTTTINCLTGLLPLTGGDAIIAGELLSSPGGLTRIRKMMGVCPQFDVLWPDLTGMEHVQLFARIKGLSRKDVNAEAMGLLDKVRLVDAAKQRSGSYSGGMKRRLSVALSLLGDPRIVFLDEPTTGMDPIARRYVWDVIESCKPGRVIVLTTHSMEEADVLGDKVAIMARGKLRCVGTSLRLKQRFGGGYYLVIAVNPKAKSSTQDPTSAVRALMQDLLQTQPTRKTTSQVEYRVPRQQEDKLPRLLKELEARKVEVGVTDVQISLTTLEDVFLGIAKAAEIEASNEQGGLFKIVQLQGSGQRSGGCCGVGRQRGECLLHIPLGAEEVVDSQSGVRYTARWAPDEEGRLQLLDVEIAPGQVNVPDEARVVHIRT